MRSNRTHRPGDIIGFRNNGQPIYLQAGGDPTATVETPAPPAYTFPFEVPTDLAAASDDTLTGLLTSVREHARTFAGLSPADVTDATITALRSCRDLATTVHTELSARRERAGEFTTLAGEIDAIEVPATGTDGTAGTDGGTGTDGGQAPAVTAATGTRQPAPSVRSVAGRSNSRTPALPEDSERPAYASMTAAADVPNFAAGQPLARFSDAAAALSARLDQYPSMTAGRATRTGDRRPVTVYDPDIPGRVLVMQKFSRHSAVQFRREFPDELRVRDGERGYAVADYAASERRLPGGSLLESAKLAARNGRALTAAAGWCAPSETIYELAELETLDGILDVPELQTTRGGWQIPVDGGPNFASIYSGIGNGGDTHLTEAEVIAGTSKVSYDIPCPPFEDIRLGVDYVSLTGGLLQRRGYPEVVARFGRAALVALAHKINQGFIGDIVAQSGAAVVVPADAGGDDAVAGLLSAVDLAITDAKYRNRMGFSATLEVVLPMWVLAQLRAAAARRSGVDLISVNDAQILEWFTVRKAVPRFVYDWQDAFSGLAAGPGGNNALTILPTTVDFLVYPAGTWVKAVQDVVALDTIYDSTNLATNEYTALFVEDGWAALQMGPTSRLYRAPVDPSGDINLS